MRHCSNEKVDVFEAIGDDLATLLRDAADQIESNDDSGRWHMLTVGSGVEGESKYLVTLYAH